MANNAYFHPMSVHNMGFLLEKLHEDCAPLQFVRELTQNAIESIKRLDNPVGKIHWDLDQKRFDLTEEKERKIAIIDNGIGMTGHEMMEYINKLSSSIHKQRRTGNYGVGAKISAAPLNPRGLVYLSWINGKGEMIHLCRDENTDQYGLIRFENGEFYQPIANDIKPDIIDKHGTMVILLGESAEDNTMESPPGSLMPSRWVYRYLNSRFFEVHAGISIKARDNQETNGSLRTVSGTKPWLDEKAQNKGSVRLDEAQATAFWWIVQEGDYKRTGHHTHPGYVAALYQNEIYDLPKGRGTTPRMQSFGVIFGCNRVVILVKPDNDDSQMITTNTARTALLVKNEPLDWAAYAAEFLEKMPEEIKDFQEAMSQTLGKDSYKKTISDRIKAMRELFKFSRLRLNPSGSYIAGDTFEDSKTSSQGGKSKGSSSGQSSAGGKDIYSLFSEKLGESADLINDFNQPHVQWISVEEGSRQKDDLEDRAARYMAAQNKVLINADFRVFTSMEARWEKKYGNNPINKVSIREAVHQWFEQQIIETIMSVHALSQSGKWSSQETEKMWDEDALTSAVLPRYHVDNSIKRELGSTIGSMSKGETNQMVAE